MDCVSCEKCRAWGKLEMLGLGTAIKLLLMPNHILSDVSIEPQYLLSRQEIVALFNLLNQLAKSVQFASHATEKELNYKINEAVQMGKLSVGYLMAAAMVGVVVVKFLSKVRRYFGKRAKKE